MIERKDRYYTLYVYTFLILAANPVLSNSEVQSRDLAATDHFAKMLSSIIKINEKRVRSIKTLINLDDLYKTRFVLRDGVSKNKPTEAKKESKLVTIIIGNNKDINKLEEKLNNNLIKYENNEQSNTNLPNGKGTFIHTRRNFDTDISSNESCDESDKQKCRIVTNRYYSREDNRSCKRKCRRGCRKACSSAFKNFCLSYACDYSMKTKIDKNCKRSCSYRFRDYD